MQGSIVQGILCTQCFVYHFTIAFHGFYITFTHIKHTSQLSAKFSKIVRTRFNGETSL